VERKAYRIALVESLIRLCNTSFMTEHIRTEADRANEKTLDELIVRSGAQFRRAREDMVMALARTEEALGRSQKLSARCSPGPALTQG
jgi:hypothetical protein